MSDDRSSLEARVEQLAAQIGSLNRRVESLAAELSRLHSGTPLSSESPDDDYGPPPPASRIESPAGDVPPAASDDLVSWVERASFLTRMSALSFLLVVALGLRTITDHGIIDRQSGAVVGMSYAALLMLVGWYLYTRSSALAPVFAACGSTLMFAVVWETHAHFGSLSSSSAYAMLALTGVAMALVSLRFGKFLPVSAGILGMCLVGFAIDFPSPPMAWLLGTLLLANGLGYSAARIRRCSWLRWIVLVMTVAAAVLWITQARFAMNNRLPVRAGLEPRMFLPAVALIGATSMTLALLGILRSGSRRLSRFDLALPTLNVIWIFVAARLFPGGLDERLLGGVGVGAAVVHFGVAHWLAVRATRSTAGAGAFGLAGAMLLALAVPVLIGNVLVALPLLSLAAIGLAALSIRWNSFSVRVTSYLLQVYSSISLSVFLGSNTRFSVSAASALAAAAPALLGFAHYRWYRTIRTPETETNRGFRAAGDRVGVLLLLAALVSTFFMTRVGLYQALSYLPGDLENSFRGGQTILINLAAAGLMLIALVRRNREIRNVAIFVTVIGVIRVAFNLLDTAGIPLVLSVFSFGLTAAVESTALGRWSRRRDP